LRPAQFDEASTNDLTFQTSIQAKVKNVRIKKIVNDVISILNTVLIKSIRTMSNTTLRAPESANLSDVLIPLGNKTRDIAYPGTKYRNSNGNITRISPIYKSRFGTAPSP